MLSIEFTKKRVEAAVGGRGAGVSGRPLTRDRSSTSAASDKCCGGSPPISISSRAQRPPPAEDPPQAGNVCSYELGTGKPALHRSGNCAPTSLTLRGAQMDVGPPAPY